MLPAGKRAPAPETNGAGEYELMKGRRNTTQRRGNVATPPDVKTSKAEQLVERIFSAPGTEGQALRRQWMQDLQLPVATIDDIVNVGGRLPEP